MTQPSPIFLTLAQASARFDISITELKRARRRGDLPGTHPPGRLGRGAAVRIRADELVAFTAGLPVGVDREEALRERERGRQISRRFRRFFGANAGASGVR